MKKAIGLAVLAATLLTGTARAGSMEEVQYGVVQESKVVSPSAAPSSASTTSGRRALRTLGAAAIGGAAGHQFGDGDGQQLATATGAMVGAAGSRRRQAAEAQPATTAIQKIQVTVKTDAGKVVSVEQDNPGNIVFKPGDKVRLLIKGSDATVEKAQ